MRERTSPEADEATERAVPWYGRRRSVWLAAGLAGLVLVVVALLLWQRHRDEALITRALSDDNNAARAAEDEIRERAPHFANRLVRMLTEDGERECAVAFRCLVAVDLRDQRELLVRLTRQQGGFRPVLAMGLLWWNGIEDRRVREVCEEIRAAKNAYLEVMAVDVLCSYSTLPDRDRAATEIAFPLAEDVGARQIPPGHSDAHLQRHAIMFLRLRREYSRPLLLARLRSPAVTAWHVKALAAQGPLSPEERAAVQRLSEDPAFPKGVDLKPLLDAK